MQPWGDSRDGGWRGGADTASNSPAGAGGRRNPGTRDDGPQDRQGRRGAPRSAAGPRRRARRTTRTAPPAAAIRLDQSANTALGVAARTAIFSTSGGLAVANELVIAGVGVLEGIAGQVVPQGASWNSLANDPPDGFTAEYRLDLPAGVANETLNATAATTWGIVMAAFKPAAATSGSVFDPGFYYFNGWNGSNVTSGGGLCPGCRAAAGRRR